MNQKQRKAWLKEIREPSRMTIEEALASGNPAYEIARRLAKKSLSEMSEEEKQFYVVHYFHMDALNGGLNQALTNSTGEFTEQVLSFAKLEGLNELEAVLASVVGMFPGGEVPLDREERADAVSEMPRSGDGDPLDELTRGFNRCEGALTEALTRFAERNRHAFNL